MIDQKSNIRIFKTESFLILLILLSILLVFNNPRSGKSGIGINNNPVTTERTISQNQAVFYPGIQIISYPESLTDPRNEMRVLTVRKAPYLESIKADIIISEFRKIRQEPGTDPIPVFRYHVFTAERDEYPHLS